VAQLGCRSFALLFDDIEAEMSKPDKEAFQSFAHAQARGDTSLMSLNIFITVLVIEKESFLLIMCDADIQGLSN